MPAASTARPSLRGPEHGALRRRRVHPGRRPRRDRRAHPGGVPVHRHARAGDVRAAGARRARPRQPDTADRDLRWRRWRARPHQRGHRDHAGRRFGARSLPAAARVGDGLSHRPHPDSAGTVEPLVVARLRARRAHRQARRRGRAGRRGRRLHPQRPLSRRRQQARRQPHRHRACETPRHQPRALQGHPRRAREGGVQRPDSGPPRRAEDRREADEQDAAPLRRRAGQHEAPARDLRQRRQVHARRDGGAAEPRRALLPADAGHRARRGEEPPGDGVRGRRHEPCRPRTAPGGARSPGRRQARRDAEKGVSRVTADPVPALSLRPPIIGALCSVYRPRDPGEHLGTGPHLRHRRRQRAPRPDPHDADRARMPVSPGVAGRGGAQGAGRGRRGGCLRRSRLGPGVVPRAHVRRREAPVGDALTPSGGGLFAQHDQQHARGRRRLEPVRHVGGHAHDGGRCRAHGMAADCQQQLPFEHHHIRVERRRVFRQALARVEGEERAVPAARLGQDTAGNAVFGRVDERVQRERLRRRQHLSGRHGESSLLKFGRPTGPRESDLHHASRARYDGGHERRRKILSEPRLLGRVGTSGEAAVES